MPESDAHKKWVKENTRRYGLKFFKSTDARVIEILDHADNVIDYVRQAVLEKAERDHKK